jgi:hypothetical protein
MKKLLAVVTLTLACHSLVWAGLETQVALFSWAAKSEGNEFGNGEALMSNINAKLGYGVSNYFVGLAYDLFNNELVSPNRPRTSYGITLGLRPHNWYFDLSYFLLSRYQIASQVEATQGNGLAFDIGYRWLLNNYFFLGTQISYRNFSYSKVDNAGVETTSTNKITSEYFPSLVLGLRF